MSYPSPRSPLRRCLLLLTLLCTALLAPAARAQSPSFSGTTYTPGNGATLRVGDTLRVTTTVTNAPTTVRLIYGEQGGFPTNLAGNLTALGSDRYELNYTVRESDLLLSANGAKRLLFQLQAFRGTTTVTSFPTSDYTIAAAGGPAPGQPDVTLGLAGADAFRIVTEGATVRLSAAVNIANEGTAPARGFNGSVVLSPGPTFNAASLLRDPATGQVIRGNFAFADFAQSAGQPVAELPAAGQFDTFRGSLTLPATSYAALLAQSPVTLYALAVLDLDNALAESDETNNAVLLGPLTTPSNGGGGGAATDFTARLKASTPNRGGVVVPEQTVVVKVKTDNLPAGVTVAAVAYTVNGQPESSAAPSAKTFQRTYSAREAGEKVLVATVTDSRGLRATTAPLTFRVAPVGLGGLALETFVDPAGARVAPGEPVTYRYVLTNTNSATTIRAVQVNAKVPNGLESLIAGPDAEFSANGKNIVFRLGDLAPAQQVTATLLGRAKADLRPGATLTDNKVKVTANDGSFPVAGNFTATPVAVAGLPVEDVPALGLGKTVVDRADDPEDTVETAPDPRPIQANVGQLVIAAPNERVTLALGAFNNGRGEARAVTVRDLTPEGCAFVEGSARLGDAPFPASDLTRTVTSSGRTSLVFSLGDLPGRSGRLVTYQVRVLPAAEGGVTRGAVVKSSGATISARNLGNAPDSVPRELPLLVAPKSAPAIEQTAVPAVAVVGQPLTYTLRLRNAGANRLKGARVVNPIPAGTEFSSASAGAEVSADRRTVTFPLGSLNPGQEATATLRVLVQPGLVNLDPAQVVNRPFFVDNSSAGQAQATAYLADLRRREQTGGGPGPRARADETLPLDLLRFAQPDYSALLDPAAGQTTVTKPFLIKLAPQSVRRGETFDVTFAGGNLLPIAGGASTIAFDLPAGTEFVSATRGGLVPGSNPRRFAANFDRLPGAGELARITLLDVRVTLRAVGNVRDRIVEGTAQLRVERSFAGFPRVPAVFAKNSTTLIIEGDAAAPDNQDAIGRAQVESQGVLALAALNDPRTFAGFRAIDGNTTAISVAGADHAQLVSGAVLVPIPVNAELVRSSGPQMVAAGGGNIVAAGGGNIVAAGGGNIVAAGGGNLVSRDATAAVTIANNGSFQVGGGSSPAAGIVAAGGGN